jgi:hypothetical protein
MTIDTIWDIDGTIANCDHRLHWIKDKPKNWKAFHAALHRDTVIEPTASILKLLWNSSSYRVIFCTARGEECRESTVEWIAENLHFNEDDVNEVLFMRPANDFRPDYEVKRELLDQIRARGFNPTLVFEDRTNVVAMWREAGLTCYQVADGDY